MIISFDCKNDNLYEALSLIEFEDRDLALTAFLHFGFNCFVTFMEKHDYDRSDERIN